MVTKKKVRKKVAATVSKTTVDNITEDVAIDPVVQLTALAKSATNIPLGAMETRFSGKLQKLAVEIGKVGVALAKALEVKAKADVKKQAQIDKYAARIAKLNTN